MPIPTPPIIDKEALVWVEFMLKWIVAPLATICGWLFIWAFSNMRSTNKEVLDALTTHVEHDDVVHDKIFTQMRSTEKILNTLVGEHNATHDREVE